MSDEVEVYVPPESDGPSKPRSFYMAAEFWSDVLEAARIRSVAEGRQVSASEILRRGAVRELRAVHRADRDGAAYSIPTQRGDS